MDELHAKALGTDVLIGITAVAAAAVATVVLYVIEPRLHRRAPRVEALLSGRF